MVYWWCNITDVGGGDDVVGGVGDDTLHEMTLHTITMWYWLVDRLAELCNLNRRSWERLHRCTGFDCIIILLHYIEII